MFLIHAHSSHSVVHWLSGLFAPSTLIIVFMLRGFMLCGSSQLASMARNGCSSVSWMACDLQAGALQPARRETGRGLVATSSDRMAEFLVGNGKTSSHREVVSTHYAGRPAVCFGHAKLKRSGW